jgi:hypothetical protein
MILTNPRWEKFAQGMAAGQRQYQAYEGAGFAARGLTASNSAQRLLANPKVMARIAELRDEGMVSYQLERRELMDYLVDIIQTPAGQVKEGDRLCHSYRHTAQRRSTSMPDKLKAAEMLAKLCGWFAPEKPEQSGELEITVRIVGEDEDSAPSKPDPETEKVVLRNARHEKFAQGVAGGKKPSQAYETAGFARKPGFGFAGSWKLMRKPEVLARIAELQRQAEAECRISRKQLLDFLVEVMLTPAGEVHVDHRLCQAFHHTKRMQWLRMPDKLKAAELVIKIHGWDEPERTEHPIEERVIRIGGE